MLRLMTGKEIYFVFFQLWTLLGVSGGVPVRLTGHGSTQCSGRVEVFYQRTWGTVCDTSWDLKDATVVCRELGCGSALSTPGSTTFGEGTGPIWLHDVACSGSESSVMHCQHGELGQHGCGHDKDAGVVCSGFEIRLVQPGQTTRCSGRVEIFHQDKWGTVCDNGWDLNDAQLVCKQLDCGTAVSAPRSAHFGEGTGPIWLDDVACSGTESSLSECGHSGFGQSSCAHSKDAGVICSAASVPNVAPTGTASQSTTIYTSASVAIDGNRNPSFWEGSCTHTYEANNNWWSVMLPAVYRITHITITNRYDAHQRINNAEILIGHSPENNGNNNPRCAIIYSIGPGSTRIFNCGGMAGHFVNVLLKRHVTALTLCEVEVYGEMAAPSFSAVVMGRSIEVVERRLCWSDALFYCRDFYWELLSIHSEEEQREVEKVLETISFPLTEHVWLGLRRYLMGATWFWMSGAAKNFTYFETNSHWQETSPCCAMDTSHNHHWGDIPCGEHLNFICLKDHQSDHKRVEFFSSTRP